MYCFKCIVKVLNCEFVIFRDKVHNKIETLPFNFFHIIEKKLFYSMITGTNLQAFCDSAIDNKYNQM